MNISEVQGKYLVETDGENRVRFDAPALGGVEPTVDIVDADDGWQRVHMTWRLDEPVQQDELAIRFEVEFDPDFWWATHLAPEDGYCIAQHVFRSPAIIAAKGRDVLVMAPDLDICGAVEANPWFMDYDVPAKAFWLGMARTEIPEHVLYRKAPGMTFAAGQVTLGFYIAAYQAEGDPVNPWERTVQFYWDRYGRPLFQKGEPGTVPMDTYVKHTYNWAFNSWKDAVWQEFEIDGKRVGAPGFIVNVTQSPNYPGEYSLREFLSIWNQTWFSSLRSASGVMRYAKRTGDKELAEKANLAKELALAAPMKDGIFPSVYATETYDLEIDGRRYRRSRGWDSGFWMNSDRCPQERGITPEWYHIADASWTCLLMLRWHEDIEPDTRLLEYAKTYAEKLLTLQDGRGFFPAWLHPETLEPSPVLFDSPETSMSVTFLLKLAQVTGDAKYREAAVKALDAVIEEIVPEGRWEDYETYWSCSPWGKNEYLGKMIPRNAAYKRNNMCTFWTAEALLEAYHATKQQRYLDWGRRTMDELATAQQVWQPPFIHVPALGGFGVMNCDGEWNDSRQTLLAELFLEYYKELGDPRLFERGIAALKAGFVMMYCPENPQQKALWEQVHPHFGPEDYGFTMENYGHGGVADKAGGGIGVFTIFDWGNGAASEARNRIHDHFGDVYIDRKRNQGFGIDSIRVEMTKAGCTLSDLANQPRDVKVVFEDGASKNIHLNGVLQLPIE